MRRASPAQLALLKEMAAGRHRQITSDGTGYEPSWDRSGKRRIAWGTIRGLTAAGCLEKHEGPFTIRWTLTPYGKRLARGTAKKLKRNPQAKPRGERVVHRDVSTGKFVSRYTKRPKSREELTHGVHVVKVARSARTGRFVKEATARRHPEHAHMEELSRGAKAGE